MTATQPTPPAALDATQARRPVPSPSRCTSPRLGAVAGVRGVTINQLIWLQTWNGGNL